VERGTIAHVKRSKEPRAFYVREEPAGGVTRFETFEEAKVFADRLAQKPLRHGSPGLCWLVVRTPRARKRILYRALPSGLPPPIGGGEGNAGVREPRRPRPGSSPAAIARSSTEM
jgi:hypothetical protein